MTGVEHDPDRWARIDRLYHAALERHADLRDSFLAEACGDDETLRQEVLSLLRFHENERFLERSPLEIAARIESRVNHPSSNTLQSGQTISHYRIIEKLGEGGMGIVFKAEDCNLGRMVALKFLAPHAMEDHDSQARFLREAKAAAALDHPNVCTVYEIGEAEGRVFLAMALVEGDRVSDRIAKRPLEVREALDVAIQTAQGLQAAHEKGIVHRDIKSSNLMINRQGQVKIMDFGIALLADRTRLTHSAMIVGTPGYLSPEQAQRRHADPRSDIWSLGIVIYEMVTGRQPFQADRDEAVIHSIIYDAHEPVTALRAGIPMELDRIIAKALAKNPDDRYQHADELLVDLRNLARQHASGLNTPSTALAGGQVSSRRERKFRLALAGVSLLFVLSLISLAVLLLRGRGPTVDEQVRRFSIPFEQARLVISPNGRHIAYRSAGRLWIRDLNSETPREIPEGKANGGYYSSAGYYLTWSPDSRELAFPAGDELRRVSVLEGGSAATICKLPTPREQGRAVAGAAWSRDGETIVFSTIGKGIYEVPARGGSPKLLWNEEHADDLIVLDTPQGRAIVFAAGGGDEGTGHALVVRTPNGERRRLLGLDAAYAELVYSPTGHILFRKNPTASASIWAIPFSKEALQVVGEPFLVLRSGQGLSLSEEGTLVYLDMGRNPQFLAWRDRAGKIVSQSSERHQVIGHLSLSPDGDRAVVTAMDDGPSVPWIYDVQRFVKTRLGVGSQTAKNVSVAVWPKPGKDIYYTLFRDTTALAADVFAKSSDDAAPPRQIPLPDAISAAFDASADGRYLLLTRFENKGVTQSLALWRNEPPGRGEMIRFSQVPESESAAVLSPNQRYVAYVSRTGGANQIFVRPFPDGPGRWQISTRGGVAPMWGPDGAELFFASGNMLMRTRVSTAGQFTAATPEPLFEHGLLSIPGVPAARYAVSPDGKKFLTVESEREFAQPAMRVVQNWLSEFRRKVNPQN